MPRHVVASVALTPQWTARYTGRPSVWRDDWQMLSANEHALNTPDNVQVNCTSRYAPLHDTLSQEHVTLISVTFHHIGPAYIQL